MRRATDPSPLLLLTLCLGVLPGCRGPAPDARPRVAVSVEPQRQLVERLAGGAVEVVAMIPASSDVESYSPSPQQMAALASARIFFKVGHPAFALERAYLEPWLARHPEVRQVSLAAHVDRLLELEPGGSDGGHGGLGDPHLWMSVRAMRGAAAELATALVELLPAATEAILARARELDAELAALDAELAERFRAAAGRRFLVYHPALGYLAHDYGLIQEAIESDGKEPSPARLAALIAGARRDGVRVVLTQRGMPPKSAQILAAEVGAVVTEVDPMAVEWLANLRRIGAAVAGALVPAGEGRDG
jgi:zinc transport system substrate-binding protein